MDSQYLCLVDLAMPHTGSQSFSDLLSMRGSRGHFGTEHELNREQYIMDLSAPSSSELLFERDFMPFIVGIILEGEFAGCFTLAIEPSNEKRERFEVLTSA
jgi:hypothetical protein